MSNLQRRTNELYGIESWLRNKGFKVTNKSVSEITAKFLKSKGIPHKEYNPRYRGLFTAGICNVYEIVANFKEFKDYYEREYGETSKN